MGCDIHLIAQVRQGDQWVTTETERPCHCVKQETPGKFVGYGGVTYDCFDCYGTLVRGSYDSRSYDTFAILANVRNSVHGYKLIPISDARGLPEDLRKPENTNGNPFSPNYYDGEGDEYIEGKWMGDHSYSWLSLRELVEYPHWHEIVPGTEETAAEHTGNFYSDFLPALVELGDLDNVRIVFGFDS